MQYYVKIEHENVQFKSMNNKVLDVTWAPRLSDRIVSSKAEWVSMWGGIPGKDHLHLELYHVFIVWLHYLLSVVFASVTMSCWASLHHLTEAQSHQKPERWLKSPTLPRLILVDSQLIRHDVNDFAGQTPLQDGSTLHRYTLKQKQTVDVHLNLTCVVWCHLMTSGSRFVVIRS